PAGEALILPPDGNLWRGSSAQRARNDERVDDNAALAARQHLDGVQIELGEGDAIGPRVVAEHFETTMKTVDVGGGMAAEAGQQLRRGGNRGDQGLGVADP